VIAITPTLFAGNPGDLVWFDDIEWADTVGEAVRIIREGRKTALIDAHGWQEKAKEIPTMLGADSDHVDRVVTTAPIVNEKPLDKWPDTIPPDL
jgi:hypothetical protein